MEDARIARSMVEYCECQYTKRVTAKSLIEIMGHLSIVDLCHGDNEHEFNDIRSHKERSTKDLVREAGYLVHVASRRDLESYYYILLYFRPKSNG